MLKTFYWKDGFFYLLDQRILPKKIVYRKHSSCRQVSCSIRAMVVRGAPAIGISAAYGLALAAQQAQKFCRSPNQVYAYLKKSALILKNSRPTAVNLQWAIDRQMKLAEDLVRQNIDIRDLARLILREAKMMHHQDRQINESIGRHGLKIFSRKKSVVLTHCNAGSLATSGYGTALGVIYSGFRNKKISLVYVDETRPYLQGLRLTSFELGYNKVPYKVIVDSLAGFLLSRRMVDIIVVGADRIAANGDVANKVGTYALSALAKVHRVPFYVAAPTSSIDLNIATGKDIVLEERAPEEVLEFFHQRIAPARARAYNLSFDITPAANISGIITEYGILKPPYKTSIARLSGNIYGKKSGLQ